MCPPGLVTVQSTSPPSGEYTARMLNVLAHTMQPCTSTTFLFSDLLMASHPRFGASASAARNPNTWVPANIVPERSLNILQEICAHPDRVLTSRIRSRDRSLRNLHKTPHSPGHPLVRISRTPPVQNQSHLRQTRRSRRAQLHPLHHFLALLPFL